MMSMIDRVMPAWDFRERHQRDIRAAPERAFAALPRVDLARSPFIGTLFRLRSLPSRLGRGAAAPLSAGRLGEFLAAAFVTLESDPPRGVLLGSVGEFWRASGGVRRFVPAQFATDATPGCARLVWSFEFVPSARGCLVRTETRIRCNDRRAYRRMLPYWLLIRGPSGLIRREILRLLERECTAAR
jgi:hypothetical protein